MSLPFILTLFISRRNTLRSSLCHNSFLYAQEGRTIVVADIEFVSARRTEHMFDRVYLTRAPPFCMPTHFHSLSPPPFHTRTHTHACARTRTHTRAHLPTAVSLQALRKTFSTNRLVRILAALRSEKMITQFPAIVSGLPLGLLCGHRNRGCRCCPFLKQKNHACALGSMFSAPFSPPSLPEHAGAQFTTHAHFPSFRRFLVSDRHAHYRRCSSSACSA